MPSNVARHRRRSIRLRGYDYTSPGAYFVTICVRDRACVLGKVVEGEMRLDSLGEIAVECWRAIPDHFPHVRLDAFVIMPNHVHGIIVIVGAVRATHASPVPHASPQRNPPRGPRPGSLGAVVGSFKSATTKRINQIRGAPGTPFWQRNYYEHVIRDQAGLDRIRRYIQANPRRWAEDRLHPDTSP